MKYKNKLTWMVMLFFLTLLLSGCVSATDVSKSEGVSSIGADATYSSEGSDNHRNGMPENGIRANALYYMPDLSAYPNLDEVMDLPPYEIHAYADGGIVDFNFVTKDAAFEDMIQKIDKALKADGFTAVTKEQYADLTNGLSKFKQGKAENTYIKLKNNKDAPYAIQIIDGGIDKNKLPIIIVRMSGSKAYPVDSNSQENQMETESGTRASVLYYMPYLSAYPNLEDELDLPPYDIYTDGSIVDFKYVTKDTKDIPFKEIIQKIDKRLKADGFTAVTEEQYTDLTNGLSEFKQGKAENTYIKYKNNNKDVTPYAIKIIDGGIDKNNLPIIIVRMAG